MGIVLTTVNNAIVLTDTNKPSADQSKSQDTSFTDVPDVPTFDVPALHSFQFRLTCLGSGYYSQAQFQVADSTSNVSYVQVTNGYEAIKRMIGTNTSTSTITLKLRFATQSNSSNGSVATVRANSCSVVIAPYRNFTNDNRKMSLTSLSFVGSTESINGIRGSELTPQTISPNAIGELKWSANSGNMLYGIVGKLIGYE
jgi:hypothetical protein